MYVIVLLLLKLCFSSHVIALISENAIQDGSVVMLSLKNYTKAHESDYQRVLLPENSNLTITVNDIPANISFIVLQVHTILFPITLSSTKEITQEKNVNGTNVGLVGFTKSAPAITFYLYNTHGLKISSLIAAVGYTTESPVPGGCAMEFPTKIAPYLDLNYSESMITVKGGPSSLLNNTVCDPRTGLKYIFHHMFVAEWDFSEETYFNSIIRMMTYSSIVDYSSVAMESATGPPLQRSFSSYRGIGRAFTVIVKSPTGGISVYVPTFTYSCNTTISTAGCALLMTTFTQIENAIIAFLGIYICFKGHRYFLLNLFVMGTLSGTVISYIILIKNISSNLMLDYTMVATSIGIVFGIIWTCVWWCLHRPILSIIIPLLNCGCLITAILFSIIRDQLPLFESDINYWVTFFSVALVLLFIFITRPLASNIGSSCIIGAYMFVVPIGISVGSSIVYVFVNVIRRATIEGFNEANTEVPCQVPDVMLWLFACLLIALGNWRQRVHAKGRPPFPPQPMIFRHEEERRLLSEPEFTNYTVEYEPTPQLG